MVFANDFINTGNALLDYWVKATLIFSVCYLVYKIWIDRSNYDFQFKRWYLNAIGLCVILVPMISIKAVPKIMYLENREVNLSSTLITETTASWDYIQWVSMLFVAGFIFSLFRFILSLIRLLGIVKRSIVRKQGKYIFVFASNHQYSSFFHFIFTNTDEKSNIQIEHEKIHVDQYHSLDVMLAELMHCILWFLPLVYPFKRDIKINHEYICDKSMIAKHGLATYVDTILMQHKSMYSNSLFNHFNSLIKNRITMMNHLKNSNNSKTNYTLVSMFFIAVFCAFSFKTYIIPVGSRSVETKTKLDTLPMDTIFTLDPVTFKETLEVVPRRSQVKENNLELEQMLKLYPEVVTYSDTSIYLDPKTYAETVVVTGKMVKAYRVMIDNELSKTNPNFDKINQWMKEGQRK